MVRHPSSALRRAGRLTVLALLALALVVQAAPLAAQDREGTDPQAESGTAGAAEEGAAPIPGDTVGEDDDLPDIDAILEADEEVLGGGGYTYDPGDRRDPFRSLLEARQADEPQGPRPEGVPGLLIDEVILSGIFRTPEGWVAQVQAANKDKSHLLKVGDQLYDGEVLSMSRNEVVFKQVINDPAALKPFREVVKKLNP